MKKFARIAAALLLACAAGLAGAQNNTTAENTNPADATRGVLLDRIVAVVNDDVIMQTELDEEATQLRAMLLDRGTPLPPEEAFRRQVLERMVDTKLQLQYAERAGILVSDDRVNQALTQIASRNNVSLSELPAMMAKQGVDYATFREKVREEMLLTEVRQRAVDDRIAVSPREIDDYLERQAHQGEGEEYLVSHILIAVPGEAPPEDIDAARRQVEDIRARVLDGTNFAEMAVTYSDGQQALEGGSLGWRKLPEIPTLFADTVAGMQAGEISAPIRSGSGWHLIRVDDTRGRERVVATETHARHILLKPNQLRSEVATRVLAQALRQRIEAGEDFAALAREFSEDPASAVQGGDLGWNPPGVFVPRFQQALDALEIDKVSAPFETQFGIHVAQVLERRDTDFTQTVAQNRAYQAIKRRKSEEQFPIWLQQEHDSAHIDIRLGG